MAQRITQADVRAAFARAIPADKRAGDFGKGHTNAHNIGKYALDYAACYGGWAIIVYSAGDSGQGYTHGNDRLAGYGKRRSSREMVAFLEGVAAGREL